MKPLRYDIEFQYVKGSDLVISDALSRAYPESKENETADRLDIRNVKNGAFDHFQMQEFWKSDAQQKKIRQCKSFST
ncbi:hypothetical protein DPMN_126092 [Dreissena polymorpha]|uniref:Uncharacterized protein n=1 Tax=Dreissena polymorpha TaxID=45954 RepID=A0A9D4GVH4_DREPO|nr:hypothetical protein DPMN_126092 [Dreissena polymorpha]